jgi:hypothetical protein
MQITILSDDNNYGGTYEWLKHNPNNIIYHHDDIYENEIIYINNYTNIKFYDNIDVIKKKNIKLCYIIHSDICPINKLLIDNIHKFDMVISINLITYNKINRLYPFIENVYLPNKYELNTVFKKEIRKINYIKINFIGRLSPEKNLPMLIESIKHIDNVILNIYGSKNDNYSKYIENMISYFNINDKVLIHNYTDNKNIMYDCDFVILPSVHEGLPYCLLEAKYYKVNIISHDISNIKFHIPNETYYQYNGLSEDLYKDALYVDSYNELLIKIGYIEFMVLRKTPIHILENIKYLISDSKGKILFNNKTIIPPCLLNMENYNYTKNIELIQNNITDCIKKFITKI